MLIFLLLEILSIQFICYRRWAFFCTFNTNSNYDDNWNSSLFSMHAPLWTSRMQQSVIACDIPIIVCGKCVQFFSSSSFSLCDSDSFSLLYISSVGFFSLIHFLPWFFASFFVWFFSYSSFFSVLYKVCLHFFNMDCFFHFIRVSHYLNLTFFLFGTQFFMEFFCCMR